MKWHCQIQPARQKLETRKLMNIDGPWHRFYPNKQGKTRSPNQSRLQSMSAQVAGDQAGCLHKVHLHSRRSGLRQQDREPNDLLYLHSQEEMLPSASESPMISASARVAWLQQNCHHLPKALSLRTCFSDVGMQVNVLQWTKDEVQSLNCDLILLECLNTREQEMMKILLKIRLFNQAPLIVLTDNHALEWSICALHGGADAIFTVNMPDEVIIARSNALLRRWLLS
jgi:hypothetical protein